MAGFKIQLMFIGFVQLFVSNEGMKHIYRNVDVEGLTSHIKFLHPRTTSSGSLPDVITAEVRTGSNTTRLVLRKNVDVDENAPVYVPRRAEDGKVRVVKDVVLDIQDSAEYQDVSNKASVEISQWLNDRNEPRYKMDGLVTLSDEKLYSVKLVSRSGRNVGKFQPGDIYQLRLAQVSPELEAMGMTDEDFEPADSDVPFQNKTSRRTKRQIKPIYIDVVTLIDHSIYQRWLQQASLMRDLDTKQNIRRHFAHLVNGINLRFKTASTRYNIRLVGYFIQDKEDGEWFTRVLKKESRYNRNNDIINGYRLLDSVRNWTNSDSGFPQNDYILAYTGHDIYSPRTGRKLLGYAKDIGSMCKNFRASSSLVDYTGRMIDDMLVSVHEVAHSFGARHDADKNSCSRSRHNIMSPTYRKSHSLVTNNEYGFSSCSVRYFREHVNGILEEGSAKSKKCLLEKLQPSSVPDISGEMPGQLYDPDIQCKMAFGTASYFLSGDTYLSQICKRMYCSDPQSFSRKPMNAAEGTSCGDRQWCVAGTCTRSGSAPSGNPNCFYGNQPQYLYRGQTCDQLITSADSTSCTRSLIRKYCCATCLKYYRNGTESTSVVPSAASPTPVTSGPSQTPTALSEPSTLNATAKTPNTSATPLTTSSTSGGPNKMAVVGGVISALVVTCVLGVAIVFIVRRRTLGKSSTQATSSSNNDLTFHSNGGFPTEAVSNFNISSMSVRFNSDTDRIVDYYI
ncbi:uncharacterized protein LOC124145540 isoform X2 [Haliotis rufescens]|uniref:uncharacterized protein LOC124145540 isoform X1 n=1 Tax=Haliotis rufescens TaxID=6454 RepID=UPI00201F35B6|nr:uncharacterized protein LOC124145540 isoform X1 [Haliotis rufescens]XP_048245856.1 uncharacterized protein LOC124145540 isoform X2 [Haliotis rufescens]